MTIRLTSNQISPSLERIRRDLQRVPRQALDFWVKSTPRRSGNARSKTQLRGQTIEANYAYARRLDQGYSRQAPKGMSKPTETYVQQLLRRIIRK